MVGVRLTKGKRKMVSVEKRGGQECRRLIAGGVVA